VQTEYSTDLVFRSREASEPLCEQLSHESVLAAHLFEHWTAPRPRAGRLQV